MGQEVTATNGNVTVTSSTATQEEVNQSVGLTADGKAVAPKEEPEAPVAPEKEPETPSEPEPEEEIEQQGAEEGEKKKSRGGFQRKIDKLIVEKSRLEGELKAERERKEKQEAKQEQPARVHAEGEPKPEDFETTEAFIKAQTRWEVKQELAQQKEVEAQAAQEVKDREVLDTYAKRVEETKANHDDWDEVYASIGEATIPQSVQLALVEMENGPEVVYHLAKNPEIRDKLNKMSAVGAVMEIGRIAATLSPSRSEEPAPKRTVSTAPAPIKPVGGGNTKSQKDLGEMSPSEYMKARQAGRTA